MCGHMQHAPLRPYEKRHFCASSPRAARVCVLTALEIVRHFASSVNNKYVYNQIALCNSSQGNSSDSAAAAAPFEWEAGAAGSAGGVGGGDELPYRLQQDADMYSAENLMRRKALKKSELIKRQINRIWMLLEKSRRGRLTKDAYISFMLRVCKILNPDFNYADALETVREDFERDAEGAVGLTYDQFCMYSASISRYRPSCRLTTQAW